MLRLCGNTGLPAQQCSREVMGVRVGECCGVRVGG